MKRALTAIGMLLVFLGMTTGTGVQPAHAAETWTASHWTTKTIYVVNKTGTSLWPVTTAVSRWNAGHVVSIHLVARCPISYACIGVYDKGRNSRYDGRTPYTADVVHEMVSAYVYLYNVHSLPYSKRLEVVLHELGHALGLPHDTLRSSIMWPTTHSQYAPTTYDFRNLARAYAHYNGV